MYEPLVRLNDVRGLIRAHRDNYELISEEVTMELTSLLADTEELPERTFEQLLKVLYDCGVDSITLLPSGWEARFSQTRPQKPDLFREILAAVISENETISLDKIFKEEKESD